MTRPTAVVTGASSGIGDQLARQLVARGHDVLLVARDGDRLAALAGDLGGAAEVLAADLTDAGDLARVEARAAQVDIVVNSAGAGTTGLFSSLPVGSEHAEVALNVLALVRLTHAALAGMVARGHGGVLNLGSVASFVPAPGSATYAATKAFVLSFSQSLHEETRGTGVTVTCLAPGFTRTEFQTRAAYDAARIPGFLWQDAEQVAVAGLDGLAAGKALVVPGALNRVLVSGTALLPRPLARRMSGLLGSH